MSEDAFCPDTFSLLTEVVSHGKLKFKSREGAEYDSTPSSSMVASRETGQAYASLRYRNTLTYTATNPINPRVRLENGCEKCGRKVVSFQRLGERGTVFSQCYCGANWHN